MVDTTKINKGVTNISDASSWLSYTINEITAWFGRLTWFEWFIIGLVLFLLLLVLYLKRQIKNGLGRKRAYY